MNRAWTVILPPFLRKRIDGRHDLQKVIDNTGWLFADKILRMGVGLVVSIWIVRYLGPEQFGILSYAVAFVALFSAVASLGLDGIVVRDIVRYPQQKEEILGTVFILKLIGGIVTLILSMTVISFLRPYEPLTLWLVGLTAAGTVFQAVDVIDLWFQSQVCSRYTVFARSGAFLLISIVKISLVLMKAPLIAFAWAGLAEFFVSAVGLVACYRISSGSIFRWRSSYPLGLRLLHQSWPLLLAYLSFLIYMRIDQVMIGNMLNDVAVGLYSASTRLFEVPVSLVVLIASSSFPVLTKLYTDNIDAFYYRYYQITYLLTIAALLLLFATLLFGKHVVIILFGETFVQSYEILSIQIIGLLFMANAGLRSSYLTISGNQRIILITTMLSAIINIALNIILIPILKVNGAAIATTITQLLSLMLLNVMFKETRQILKIQLRTLLLIPPRTRFNREYTDVST